MPARSEAVDRELSAGVQRRLDHAVRTLEPHPSRARFELAIQHLTREAEATGGRARANLQIDLVAGGDEQETGMTPAGAAHARGSRRQPAVEDGRGHSAAPHA